MPNAAKFLGDWHVGTGFVVLALVAIIIQGLFLFHALFGPSPKYKIAAPNRNRIDSEDFLRVLEALTDSKVNRRTNLEVLTNGDEFYEAELKAIAAAQRHVHLEAYIFQRGEIAQRFVEALTERARAGVQVRVLLDGLGSLGTTQRYLEPLTEAGGQAAFYNAVHWYTLPHYNNRTHRELLIVDGTTGFIGGAGIGDHWYKGDDRNPRWRDTMVRVTGEAVGNLQATFAENWLESKGELLSDPAYFPSQPQANDTTALVVHSTPSTGGSSRARVLFQALVAAAESSILITTPYFLPDDSMQDELTRAVQRGVKVRIVVPGGKSDHMLTRSSSRLCYGKLLRAGAEIAEYQPSMIHAKVLVVDSTWAVIGSTNFDDRSFGLNDEVNLAVRDSAFAARLERDFARDMALSNPVSYEQWRKRSVFERAPELVGWVLRKQQ
jgi:cardiolipin synthase